MSNQKEDLTTELNSWYRKRKITTSIGIILQCVAFFEYASITISALYYYKDSFNVANPNFYYGCVMSIIFVSGVVSVKFSGMFMDRTRNLRQITMFLLVCNIAGNVIYTMTFSPWCPILGRFVCGTSVGIEVIFSG